LIAHIVANTGWTWDEALDNLTLPRLRALQAEWRAHPPAHWLLAALARYKPPAEDQLSPGADRRATVAAIQATFPGGKL
jgi:hypothetical protein